MHADESATRSNRAIIETIHCLQHNTTITTIIKVITVKTMTTNTIITTTNSRVKKYCHHFVFSNKYSHHKQHYYYNSHHCNTITLPPKFHTFTINTPSPLTVIKTTITRENSNFYFNKQQLDTTVSTATIVPKYYYLCSRHHYHFYNCWRTFVFFNFSREKYWFNTVNEVNTFVVCPSCCSEASPDCNVVRGVLLLYAAPLLFVCLYLFSVDCGKLQLGAYVLECV